MILESDSSTQGNPSRFNLFGKRSMITDRPEQLGLGAVPQILGKLLERFYTLFLPGFVDEDAVNDPEQQQGT